MNTPSLGSARIASTRGHTIHNGIRIPERIEIVADPGNQFEVAGPRAKLYFDAKRMRGKEATRRSGRAGPFSTPRAWASSLPTGRFEITATAFGR